MRMIVDCERMKYPHTGFYHYCMHLGQQLLLQAGNKKEMLSFYVPPSANGIFGNNVNYLTQQPWHKFYNPFATGYDLWHCTYQGSMYYPTARRQKRIFTIHDLNFIFDKNRTDANKKKHLQILQEKINRSHYLTCISQFTLNQLQQHLNTADIPTSVIYNGSNVPATVQSDKPAFVANHTPFLFTIGTIIAEKNFHVLIPLLKQNDYKLYIAGITQDEQYKNKIIDEAKKWGVADRVTLTGSITENEKWWLMKNCTAFLFPSLAEGFGLPVVEAMHFGKPVILSTNTCLPEIGGDAAYYFNSFNPVEMQQNFTDALQHFYAVENASFVTAHAAKFSWENAAEEYWDIYLQLLNLKK